MSFNCRRCGKCCKDLLIRDLGLLRGLTLLPEEINHFPAELVKPYLGMGKRPNDPMFEVVAYQLTIATCLHLEADSCTIYLERPHACRQYPFSLDPDTDGGTLLGVDMNCPAAVELVNSSGGLIEFPNRDSAMRFLELKKYAMDNPRKTWLYDLDKENWVRIDELG